MTEQPRSNLPPQPSPLVTEQMRLDRYTQLRQRIEPITTTQELDRKQIFSLTITGSIKAGGDMDQPSEAYATEQFLIDLIFKPNKPELSLAPEHIQLLLAYFEEALKQIEGR